MMTVHGFTSWWRVSSGRQVLTLIWTDLDKGGACISLDLVLRCCPWLMLLAWHIQCKCRAPQAWLPGQTPGQYIALFSWLPLAALHALFTCCICL